MVGNALQVAASASWLTCAAILALLGWKTAKNLKLLLQKVLKQSDVGNLGRIVLPKKEAESHLPELEQEMGFPLPWKILEHLVFGICVIGFGLITNIGDFVRVNGLQEGDFIVIYSYTKCGKYMIRGVKVRQSGGKLEGKKPARRNIRNLSSLGMVETVGLYEGNDSSEEAN